MRRVSWSGRRVLGGALLGLCILVTPGCLTGRLARFSRFDPPKSEGLLHPGFSSLTQCLDQLGAPLLVQEHIDGAVLAYGWSDDRAFGLDLTVPLAHSNQGSVHYDRSLVGLHGLVLFFDEDWKLDRMERGYLSELVPGGLVRSNLVE